MFHMINNVNDYIRYINLLLSMFFAPSVLSRMFRQALMMAQRPFLPALSSTEFHPFQNLDPGISRAYARAQRLGRLPETPRKGHFIEKNGARRARPQRCPAF